MTAIDYIFPIFEDAGGKEGVDLIGNGFFVGNLFITADHVVSDSYFVPFIIVNGTKYNLEESCKIQLNYNSIIYDAEGHPYGHEDNSKTDLVVYRFENLIIESPLKLSENIPTYGQQLSCDFYHRIKDSANPSKACEFNYPIPLFAWETKGVVETDEKYFIGNFFGSRMSPIHPFKRSSGSPLYASNIVYRILHAGGGDLCVFYSAAHALKTICKCSSY